jgi:hypothetical protein
VLDLLGAALTLLTLGLVGLVGFLFAVRLLGRRAGAEPLALAIAALLATTAQAIAVAFLLGALGALRIELALAVEALAAVALLRWPRRLAPGELRGLAAGLAAACWRQLRAHPALSLAVFHGAGSEALRGLLRPPLSWDALHYHLLLAATWLQEGNVRPVFGAFPVNYYGYAPANGSLWLWWWMAPAHGELYVNLAFLPQWALLGLAAAGVARRLGAERHWPLAGFAVVATPAVLRFAATPYVDILTAAALLAAAYFGLRWLREPAGGEALLAGAGLGIAAGTKVLGIPYAITLGLAVVALARSDWRRRLPQLAAALLAAAALGGGFYLRNVALGVDPLALECEATGRSEPRAETHRLPRLGSVADLPREMWLEGEAVRSLLGSTEPALLEMGVGPAVLLLLPAVLLLPFAAAAARRREAWLVWSQVVLEVAFWAVVPYAGIGHVYANTRYLLPAVGLAFAAAVALAETRGARETLLRGLALAVVLQGLLMLHAEMPLGVRIAAGLADLAVACLALSARARAAVRARWRGLAAGALLLAVLAAPLFARFRLLDRGRALREEFTVHVTPAPLYAAAWEVLDTNGGSGTVAVASSAVNGFRYPAMGPRLERRAIYVNLNAADHRAAAEYPGCNPRVRPSAEAWLANLEEAGVRWVHLIRDPRTPWPIEAKWIYERPERFAVRQADELGALFEVLPVTRNAPPPARDAPRDGERRGEQDPPRARGG